MSNGSDNSGVTIEVNLSEQGYARLSNIANALAAKDSKVTLGGVFSAALELGTAILEKQLARKLQPKSFGPGRRAH